MWRPQGQQGLLGGWYTFVDRIVVDLVISGKDVTINTTLNPEISLLNCSQDGLGCLFAKAVYSEVKGYAEIPLQNSQTF